MVRIIEETWVINWEKPVNDGGERQMKQITDEEMQTLLDAATRGLTLAEKDVIDATKFGDEKDQYEAIAICRSWNTTIMAIEERLSNDSEVDAKD